MSDAKHIIPCLDIKNGRVVKGVNFVDIRDAGDPVEIAKRYNDQGADELAFLDISATNEGRDTMVDLVKEVAKVISIPLTVGGGIRELEDIGRILEAGASKVSINSAAVKRPELIKEAAAKFGSDKLVVALDVKETSPSAWEIITHGGEKGTGLDAVEWAKKMADLGAGAILLTSMNRDGAKTGFDLAATRAIADAISIPVIASGGVGELDHFVEGVTQGHASAVLAASVFHYGEFTVRQVKEHMAAAGIKVNL